MAAYRHGVFPWYDAGQPILWWSPDPRLVLFPDDVRVSRSLAKVLRRDNYQFSFDRAFPAVIDACAAPREGERGTWITPAMRAAYIELHGLGHAHSAEIWMDGRLAGGLYGVALGRVFFGESMFHRVSNASKLAFVLMVHLLREWNYALIDCQVHTAHLQTLGAREIAREEFARLLDVYGDESACEVAWRPLTREA
ncbi:MAG TPA: leucyl/phenylalanyl-tRNA--protein transferase [Methylococcaceae bacterium]|nr:leucyl/phenylalanyl-tRNA--protein transferase [Methylococcaceae bacterium]